MLARDNRSLHNSGNSIKNQPIRATYLMPFFRTIGGHIVGTAIPIFVRLNGGGDFLTSVVQSAYAMMYIFSPLLLGALAKRLGRRAALLVGSGLTIVDFVIYASLWNAVSPAVFPTIVTIFFFTRVGDATWNALYWPVIQSRITDEKTIMPNPSGAESHVRHFNFSWTAGIVIGNMIVTLATLAPTTEGILMGLFVAMCAALASVVINFLIGVRYFRNILISPPETNPAQSSEKESAAADSRTSKVHLLTVILPALFVIFIYGFTLQQEAQTVTNLFTVGARVGMGGLSLVPFIPLLLSMRAGFLGMASSVVKVPAAPQKRFPRVLLEYAVLMGGLSIAVALLPPAEIPGLVLIFPIVAAIGWVSGLAYAASLMKVVNEGQCTNAHWFTALFEGIQSLGITLGGLTSGALTEVAPYWMPPLANLGIILLFLVLVMRSTTRSS